MRKIQVYDFDIEYVKGKSNIIDDALSRRPTALSLRGMDVDWKDQLLVEYSKDDFACEILEAEVSDERFKVMDEVICYKDWIYLAKNSELKEKILLASHDSPLAGHQGFAKTYRSIRERFSWKGLKGDVLRHVWECTIFQ